MEGEHTPATQTPVPASQNYAIPLAIVIAGLAIAGAIYFGGNKNTDRDQSARRAQVTAISDKDHILGNPNAKIVIVEYSDLECPWCKVFHKTMQQIMNDYGKDGKVAWVYRQFPIAGLHPKAHHESEASECADKLGGNTKFWEYINKIFDITPSNNGLDPALLSKTANDIGLDTTAFNACLDKGEMGSIVDASIKDGLNAGADAGTPHSVILVNGKVVDSINGAQAYETVKAQIEALLK